MTEETTNETVQTEAAPLQVTAGDIALVVKVIDAGAERGAWKGEEMGTIGALRAKMVAIVKAVAPVEDAVAESAEDSDEVVAEDTAVEETGGEAKPRRKRGSKSAA